MLAFKHHYEERIKEIANMDLCPRLSCYHCFRRKCIVREDAIRRVKEEAED